MSASEARSRRFIQCDVFSATPTRGNALAVVVDGAGLSTETMQTFAAWTNLAETTFLLPPEDPAADYKVRIFTTTREMLFAGHPTLGSCAAWLHSGGVPQQAGVVRQECGVGIVEISLQGDRPAFVAPPTQISSLPDANREAIISALALDPSTVVRTAELDNGPVWQLFELDSAATVLDVDSSRVAWPEHQAVGLIGPHEADAECDYEVRMLAPSSGMTEDPITGSLNSAIAHWLQQQHRLAGPIVVAQGQRIGRQGRVFITPHAGQVLIGGDTHLLIEGSVVL